MGDGGSDSFFYTGDPGSTDSYDPSVMGDPSNYGGSPGLDLSQLLPMLQGPSAAQQINPMTPFNPADPSYGNYAMNWDGTPAAGAAFSPGGASGILGMIASALGLKSSQLLPLLLAGGGALWGGLNARNATNQATQDITNAYNKANSQITSILGGANTAFQPYMNLGQFATQGLQQLGNAPIAQNFRPLGSGRGVVTLGQLGGH